MDDPQKKAEVAQSTLNCLMTGDFLESLGKELRLVVPPDLPVSTLSKAPSGAKKETAADAGNANILPIGSSLSPCSGTVGSMSHGMLHQQGIAKEDESERNKHINGDLLDNSLQLDHGTSNDKSEKVDLEKIIKESRKAKLSPGHFRKSSVLSSNDERSKKRSRRYQNSDSDSGGDSSSSYRKRHHSRSKGRNKESSQEKRRYRESDSHSDLSCDYQEMPF